MRRITRGLLFGAAGAGAAVLLRTGTHENKLLRHGVDHAARRLRYLSGRLEGLSYRLSGRRPDPDVIDNVLADRIRSTLGTLERRLDLPHVHVMVEDHVALLHGEVTSHREAEEIERAVGAVSGVTGTESYLHVGLTPGDTRPSAGRAVHQPSEGMRKLLAAAEAAGVDPASAPAVVRGVLGTFAERLPEAQREHIVTHLPADVGGWFVPPRRLRAAAPPRTVHDLVARVAVDLPAGRAEQVTGAVIDVLRQLVPDDAAAVAAVLPSELRALWQGARTA